MYYCSRAQDKPGRFPGGPVAFFFLHSLLVSRHRPDFTLSLSLFSFSRSLLRSSSSAVSPHRSLYYCYLICKRPPKNGSRPEMRRRTNLMKFQYTLNIMISIVIKHFHRVRHHPFPASTRTSNSVNIV